MPKARAKQIEIKVFGEWTEAHAKAYQDFVLESMKKASATASGAADRRALNATGMSNQGHIQSANEPHSSAAVKAKQARHHHLAPEDGLE